VTDNALFLFGLLVFVVVGGGFAVTILEFRRMGNRDQNDAYPPSRSIRSQK